MTVESIFSEVFAIPQASVHDGLALRDIAAWDSMSHMVLITRLEESFQVEFTGDEIADMKTVGDARQAVQNLLKSE